MATRTTYLNLIKPDYSDAADIADINANMDTLDDKIKGIDSAAIDDTLVPTSDNGTIRNQLSQLANRIKAATGAGDWKDDPSTTLASLATLVSNLAIGSDVTWDGKKFTNTKLGISGLMDANGYVSFGKNFGGLIIQWGFYNCNQIISFPLAFNSNAYNAVTTVVAGSADINNYAVSIEHSSNSMLTLNGWRNGTKQSDIYASVVAFGK